MVLATSLRGKVESLLLRRQVEVEYLVRGQNHLARQPRSRLQSLKPYWVKYEFCECESVTTAILLLFGPQIFSSSSISHTSHPSWSRPTYPIIWYQANIFAMSKILRGLLIVVIAIALRNAPGAPMHTYFADERTTKEAPKDQPSFSVNAQGVVRFVGGDGITRLTGHIHHREQNDDTTAPVVIMAHGLGYSADCGLTPFIEAFQEAGFAVFTFDYATLGASDGFPRHEVFPQRQVGDLQAAVTAVAQHGDQLGVDSSRIVLWGTSLGGGHVISAAATLHDRPSMIRAVVSLVPNLGSPLESALGVSLNNALAPSTIL